MARSQRGARPFGSKATRRCRELPVYGWLIALFVAGCVESNTSSNAAVGADAAVSSPDAAGVSTSGVTFDATSNATVRSGDTVNSTSRVNDATSLDVSTSASTLDATESSVETIASTSTSTWESDATSASGASVSFTSLDAGLSSPDVSTSVVPDSTTELQPTTTHLADTSHELDSGGNSSAGGSSAGGPAAGDAGFDLCGEAGFAACDEPEPGPDAALLCGNGTVERYDDEECDDGNDAVSDGCSYCRVEPDWRCDAGKPCISLLADQPCTDGCWAGDACIEVSSGVTCACPAVQPNACAAVYLRSYPAFEGSKSCWASDVDADGATIVGRCHEAIGWQGFPVVWRRGVLPARLAERGGAEAVSADGGSIVLWGGDGTVTWVPSGTAISEEAFVQYPWGMNASGSTVVGDSFIWSQAGGAVQLLSPDGLTLSGVGHDVAEADSSLGGRVVGTARDEDGGYWAAIWTMSGTPTWLAKLDGTTASEAHAISADGSVVVGEVWIGDETEAVRWTSDGIERIGPQGAYAVSADGTLIAGHDRLGAWLYDDVSGLRRVRDMLTDLGMSLEGWGPFSFSAMSPDGHILVGSGQYLGDDQPNSRPRAISVSLPVQ